MTEFTKQHREMTVDQWLQAIEKDPELVSLQMAYYQPGTNPERTDGKWDWELYLEADPTIEVFREEWGPDYEHPNGLWLNKYDEIPSAKCWLNE